MAGATSKADFTGRTALHVAVTMDNPLAVSQLSSHGFDVLAKDKTGKTPVQLALDAGLDEVLRELQACGAPLTATVKPNHGAKSLLRSLCADNKERVLSLRVSVPCHCCCMRSHRLTCWRGVAPVGVPQSCTPLLTTRRRLRRRSTVAGSARRCHTLPSTFATCLLWTAACLRHGFSRSFTPRSVSGWSNRRSLCVIKGVPSSCAWASFTV